MNVYQVTTELPSDYKGIQIVNSFNELIEASMDLSQGILDDEVNLVIFRRGKLIGDFNKLAKRVFEENIKGEKDLREWFHSERVDKIYSAELAAANQVLSDFDRLYNGKMCAIDHKGHPEANVRRFHADLYHNRILVCYNEPATEWVKNEDANFKETFVKLGPDGRCDNAKHIPIYKVKDGATRYRLKAGDVIAFSGTDNQDKPPFIHRSTSPKKGEHRLLIAEG
jgi:hypothetical protein